ncbi:MAG TPA: single-stranded DNA-binding protein [Oceanipulchritudo sp.]|nr:single-stranded DNA-binding protein [Oceanipulchritudo sp.]
MANFNKVLLMGNLTRDPEVRTTPSGLKIAKFGLAVNRRYRTRDDETKEETTFVDLDAFGNQAEIIERYCQKGSPLFVEGRLRLDQWETNTGEKRSKLSVVVENFQLMSGGSDRPEESRPGQSAPVAESKGRSSKAPDTIDDDDVPF